jgi:galactose mutarotase-like enzyme
MADGCVTRAKKVNVLIQSGQCAVRLLPEFGGKIASIQVKGHELLQAPLAPLRARSRTMPFDAGDASGWDECLPSVAACSVQTDAGLAEVPDHGDLWRVRWECDEFDASDQKVAKRDGAKSKPALPVRLQAQCFSLPLKLERTFELRQSRKGWELELHYTLSNVGRFAVPWSWAAHPLFAVEAADRIELPDSMRTLRVEGSAGKRLGSAGDQVAWPCPKLAPGRPVNLSVVEPERSRIAEKLFAGPLRQSESWCALHRPRAGLKIRFRFDSKATPYLGVWLCYGGWPERSEARQMCVALEPSTAPVDSLAETGSWTRILAPGASEKWPLWVDLESS